MENKISDIIQRRRRPVRTDLRRASSWRSGTTPRPILDSALNTPTSCKSYNSCRYYMDFCYPSTEDINLKLFGTSNLINRRKKINVSRIKYRSKR